MLKLCRLSTSVVRTVWTVVGLALLSGSSYADTITHVYYTLDGNPGTLNVVGFNGTNFVGGVTELEPLIPNWGAMSLTAWPCSRKRLAQ